jgi:N-acetylglucosaminyldiphosphoundecaprenol N-acetyl-beta-D-mannosaminyltransferase
MKIDILGVKIDSLKFEEAVDKIDGFVSGRKRCYQVVTVNPEFVVAAQYNRSFKKILNNADLSVPDGKGLEYAAKAQGEKFVERITGVDLCWALAKLAEDKGYRIYLLGADPGVALQVANRLKLIHPQIKIVGTYSGKPDEKGLIDRVNQATPDILLVAFGAPKQEKFIYQNRRKLNCKVAIGVGGTFDYISGIVDRAPLWMRKIGLEWLYRLFKQPKRIKRILTAVVIFPILFFAKSLIKKQNP